MQDIIKTFVMNADYFFFTRKLARAGNNSIAPSILILNMNINRMPMSVWNFKGEKIQVMTPMVRVIAVNSTAKPDVANVSSKASVSV